MSIMQFLKNQFLRFVTVQAFTNLAIGTLGLIYQPGAQFGYQAFFLPSVYALVCILPGLFFYTSRDLTRNQMVVREILRILVTEAVFLTFMTFVNGLREPVMILAVALSVLCIEALLWFVNWLRDSREAKFLNVHLERLQREELEAQGG